MCFTLKQDKLGYLKIVTVVIEFYANSVNGPKNYNGIQTSYLSMGRERTIAIFYMHVFKLFTILLQIALKVDIAWSTFEF